MPLKANDKVVHSKLEEAKMNNRKSIDELEREGWEKIDVFSHEYYVMSRGSQRMVVDEDGEIIVVY